MYKKTYKLLSISALAVFVAMATGCATTKQLEEVRAIAEGAQGTASDAANAAASADSKAESASSTADQALDAASEAQACCNANTERLDRMFEKAMRK